MTVVAEADQVMFYDAVETVDDLQSIEEIPTLRTRDPRLLELQSRLAKICQNKAAVRNKKVRIIFWCCALIFVSFFFYLKIVAWIVLDSISKC